MKAPFGVSQTCVLPVRSLMNPRVSTDLNTEFCAAMWSESALKEDMCTADSGSAILTSWTPPQRSVVDSVLI